MTPDNDDSTASERPNKTRTSPLPGGLAIWLALAALVISVGHVVYAIWRDHLNGGEGLLSILR